MKNLSALSLAILIFCSACATRSHQTPAYIGEAIEDCNFEDIPIIEIGFSSATDKINMTMTGWTLSSAVGSHQFKGIQLCQRASPDSCISADGEFELQELSSKEAIGRLRFTSIPPSSWQPFVLKARQLRVVCG
jgi:hypothetical protein